MGNFLEALYIMLFIRGNERPGILKHLEASNNRHAVLVEMLFDVANERLWDACIDELSNFMQERSPACVNRHAWQNSPGVKEGDDLDKAKKVAEELGNKTLIDMLRATFYVKWSGVEH